MRPDVAVDLDHQVVLTIVFRNSQILGPMQFHPRLLNQGRVRWERCEINPNAPTHNHPFWIFHGPSPQPAQPAWSHLTKRNFATACNTHETRCVLYLQMPRGCKFERVLIIFRHLMSETICSSNFNTVLVCQSLVSAYFFFATSNSVKNLPGFQKSRWRVWLGQTLDG
jgi:hypothetical protein